MADKPSQNMGLYQTTSQQLRLTQQMLMKLDLLAASHLEIHKILEQEESQNEIIENVIYDPFEDQEVSTESEDAENTPPSLAQQAPETDGVKQLEFDDDKDSHLGDIETEEFGDAFADEYDPASGAKSPMDVAANTREGSVDPENIQDLTGYLMNQVRNSGISEKVQEACEIIVVNFIDDKGYFSGDASTIPAKFNVDERHVTEALKIIKSLSPAGIGASSLTECLQIQLKRSGMEGSLAWKIVSDDRLDLVGKGKIDKLASIYKVMPGHIRNAVVAIRGLDPYPGSKFGLSADTIRPEIKIVKKPLGKYEIQIEGEMPQINIDEESRARLVQSKDGKKIVRSAVSRINAILMAIEQRNNTIRRVVKKIIALQPDFFADLGNKEKLKSLTEKKIAEEIGLAESTVSRALSGRYAILPDGEVAPLFMFFPSKLRGFNGEEGVSSDKAKAEIQKLIDGEPKTKPYTDDKLVELLAERGVNIKRRTVSKYREELGIPLKGRRKSGE